MQNHFYVGDKIAGLTVHARPQGSWRWQKRGIIRVGYSDTQKGLNDYRFKKSNVKIIYESGLTALEVTKKSKYYPTREYAENVYDYLKKIAADTMANMI